jgi:hypothetical protein
MVQRVRTAARVQQALLVFTKRKIMMDPQDTLRFYRGDLVHKITVRVDVE